MFGYVTPNAKALSEAENGRFSQLYCGLCRALGARAGAFSRVALTYDMTFLALLLSSLYEPEETLDAVRCAPHPLKKHASVSDEIVDYAADMSVLVTFHKLEDDRRDDRSPAAGAALKLLKNSCARVAQAYPDKARAVEDAMQTVLEAESARPYRPDDALNAFGVLTGELFVCRPDRWETLLRAMGEGLGRFVYAMDAYDDIEKDEKRGRPNLFAGDADPQCAQALLRVLIGEATDAFEKLPLERDLGILRNILYSGVWTKFEIRKSWRERRRGHGSV